MQVGRDSGMGMKLAFGIMVSAWICCSYSKAFVSPSTRTRPAGVLTFRASVSLGYPSPLPVQSHRKFSGGVSLLRRMPHKTAFEGRDEGGVVVWAESAGARRSMTMVLQAKEEPTLSEEELSEMARARDEVNRKLEEFVIAKKEAKAAKIREERELATARIKERVRAEKEQIAHAKVYIPQRLKEIEQEEALLRTRVTDFNAKIKDTDLRPL